MIYLIHFDSKLHHAQHYLGFAEGDEVEVANRFERHVAGQGAKILRAVKAAGIGFSVVRLWQGDRTFERKLKNRKKARMLCPICSKVTTFTPINSPLTYAPSTSR